MIPAPFSVTPPFSERLQTVALGGTNQRWLATPSGGACYRTPFGSPGR